MDTSVRAKEIQIINSLISILQNHIAKLTPYPIRLRPKPDELISSWIIRLAMAHGVKLHTFCSLTFPGKPIWDRDIDKSADDTIISILSRKTGTTFERSANTTLSSYQGMFFETYNRFGPTAWILPVGVYGRFRKYYGQQLCPLCLAEDDEAYYRRRWRMAFMFCCDIHGTVLLEKCPDCKAPINFHRDELGDFHKFAANTVSQCYLCGLDFCYLAKNAQFEKVTRDELNFVRVLLNPLNNELIMFGEEFFSFPHLFFNGLRQLIATLASNKLCIQKMRNYLGNIFEVDVSFIGIEKGVSIFEKMLLNQRRQLLNLSRCLLSNWSDTFLEAAKKYKVWSSFWLKHLESERTKWGRNQRVAPYWYYRVIRDLYRPIYYPTEQEIRSAINYIKKRDPKYSQSKLCEYFAEAVVYKRTKRLQIM